MSFWSRISRSVGSTPDSVQPLDGPGNAVAVEEAGETEVAHLAKDRLDYLFRDGPRHGAVNPLLYVLQRYRQQQNPPR